ncbi:MAG: hypothetical protein HQ581_26540, partial [Planctomycetes bacterium]|nr:hypothetical protein [Planctomycetota bacterium]
MSATEQIYCTHCTYGTSAIHRETGATRDDVHGYGVRAGSLQGDALKQGYERIEHLLHYALPEGTPPGNLQTGTAANSPKRLVYLPGVDDVRVLARICYRQTDTTGQRYGSYFAHVLTRELHDGGNPRPHWNGMDALQLW